MAEKSSKGLDTGTKVVVGLAAVAMILFLVNGSPDNDSWTDDGDGSAATVDGETTGADASRDGSDVPVDDPWTRGAGTGDGSGDEDDEAADVPVDDPWTRGPPSGAGDGDADDGDTELPADDPWTRGSDATGGFGDDGPSRCLGVMPFQTADGSVLLPTDRHDDAFASPDCTISPGQSGDPVSLVQLALAGCNGQAVPVDGSYGDALGWALGAVQSAAGLTVDGIYGPETREAMAWPTELDDGGTSCVAHPGV